MSATVNWPTEQPRDNPAALWKLQWELLSIAESLLGPRDTSKQIYQPQFADAGPFIRNTPDLDGAFVELSRNGEGYWPTVVYEMAHETVHLLNPIAGNTNYLEEGVAVAFSLHVQPLYGISIETTYPSYLSALRLVSHLPGGPLEAARRIRHRVGALSDVTPQHLAELFPRVDHVDLDSLAAAFIRNSS